MLGSRLGKIHFWITFAAFNCTFFPMHILGIGGHMRRIYNPMQYEFLQQFEGWNIFISISAFVLGFSQLIFLFNFFWSMFKGKKADDNPWRATTLEWTTATPPPHGNFDVLPTVYHGPCEYSVPGAKKDFTMQTENVDLQAMSGNGGNGV